MDDETDDLDKTVKEMLDDFEVSKDGSEDNRDHALRVLNFCRPGSEQFDEDERTHRKGRPTYSFNQLPKFGRQVTNDMRMNMPQIKYIPGNDKDASKEGAEIREDLVRAIQTTTEAEVAYDIATDSQVTIGWGYWSLITDYENETDFDQVIKYRSIFNPFMIYDDPFCTKPDKSDRSFLIELEDYQLSRFNREYGKDYKTDDYNGYDYNASDLKSIGDSYPDWVSEGDEILRVGHYWKTRYTKKQLWQNKKTGEITETKPEATSKYNVRDIFTKKVMRYKCTARDLLEKSEFIIDEIPYFYVEGVSTYVDGKQYITGLYEDAISVQRLYNYSMNSAIELMALAPKQPYIGDYRAFKGFEKEWGTANQKTYPYLPVNAIDDANQPIAMPQRQQNSADLGSAATMLQLAESNFSSTIGLFDANLGKSSNEKSGKAIIARQKEGDTSTFHFPDNLARAQRYCGRVLLKMIEKVYDGARMVQLVSEDKKPRVQPINQKYKDEKTGEEKRFDMNVGIYDVVVTTGASYATKRQEAAEAQVQLAQAYPPLMQAAGDEIVRNMDWPGADKIADRLQKLLPPQLQEQPNIKDIPPQVQAQLHQAEQMIQALAQQLQEAQAAANDKQAENQAKLGDLQVKAQSAQNQQQKDQYEAEYKMALIQFEREKLATETMLEQENIKLEYAKLGVSQMQAGQEPTQQSAPSLAGLGANALQGHLADMEVQTQQQQQQSQIDQQNKQKQMETETQLKVVELTQQEQNAQMLMSTILAVKESLDAQTQATQNLTATVAAPRKAVFGEDGRIAGVVVAT